MGDGALERWWDWLHALRVKLGTREKPAPYTVLAAKLGLHENTVLNWTDASLPSVKHEAKLAEVSGEDLAHVQALLDAARQDLLARKLARKIEKARAGFERQRQSKSALARKGLQKATAGQHRLWRSDTRPPVPAVR